jgi:hypothetical protein
MIILKKGEVMAKVYLFRNPLNGKIVERNSAGPVSDIVSNVRLEYIGEREEEKKADVVADIVVEKKQEVKAGKNKLKRG